jgi:hypothetical protein
VDPKHIAEVKRIMGIKLEASPYAPLAEVYAIGSEVYARSMAFNAKLCATSEPK